MAKGKLEKALEILLILEGGVVGTISGYYHRGSCHTIRYSSNLIKFESWEEAIAEGLKPCGVCMPFYKSFVEIVTGNISTYHLADCRILRNAPRSQLKKFKSWESAAAEGMKPCSVCRPYFSKLQAEEMIGGKYTYHRPDCPCLQYIQPQHIYRYQSWSEAEAHGKKPCELCRPSLIITMESSPPREIPTPEPTLTIEEEPTPPTVDHPKPPRPEEPDKIVDVDQLAQWRRKVIRLVGKLDQAHGRPAGKGIAGQISRLERDNVIPRDLAKFMLIVTEMRNMAEYESKILSRSESNAVRAAWKVIEEWAQANHIE
jgi:methylphosphotriester-DNA--protein-cysteine methyltransferase